MIVAFPVFWSTNALYRNGSNSNYDISTSFYVYIQVYNPLQIECLN